MTKSTRAEMRDWVKEAIQGEREFQIPVLAEQTLNHFLKKDGFSDRFFKENAASLVYDIVKQVVSQSRGNLIAIGDVVSSKDEFERRAKRHSVFSNWLEHVGDRHVRLMDMTREDLLVAADSRQKRAETEMSIARIWRDLAAKMGPGDRVRDVFTEADLEAAQLANHLAA